MNWHDFYEWIGEHSVLVSLAAVLVNVFMVLLALVVYRGNSVWRRNQLQREVSAWLIRRKDEYGEFRDNLCIQNSSKQAIYEVRAKVMQTDVMIATYQKGFRVPPPLTFDIDMIPMVSPESKEFTIVEGYGLNLSESRIYPVNLSFRGPDRRNYRVFSISPVKLAWKRCSRWLLIWARRLVCLIRRREWSGVTWN